MFTVSPTVMWNIIIFLVMYGIAATVHALHARAELKHEQQEHQKEHKSHKFAVIAAVALHPTAIDTMKDFAIHLIVYSGMIIPNH